MGLEESITTPTENGSVFFVVMNIDNYIKDCIFDELTAIGFSKSKDEIKVVKFKNKFVICFMLSNEKDTKMIDINVGNMHSPRPNGETFESEIRAEVSDVVYQKIILCDSCGQDRIYNDNEELWVCQFCKYELDEYDIDESHL